jgi:hypothetical protein
MNDEVDAFKGFDGRRRKKTMGVRNNPYDNILLVFEINRHKHLSRPATS